MKNKWLKIVIVVLLVLISVGGVLFFTGRDRALDQDVILVIDDEKVRIPEAMIYYRLMQMHFEEVAGEEVWGMDLFGFDPWQEAVDRVLESIIRIKVVQPLAGNLNEEDLFAIQKATEQLSTLLGKEFMDENEIDHSLVEKVVRENYLAHQYENNARFRTSDFEEDIQRQMEQNYGIYEEIDQGEYLWSVNLLPMVFYTGQFADGVWVTYPEIQREQILEQAKNVLQQLDTGNFYRLSIVNSDTISMEEIPMFTAGAIQSPRMNTGSLYIGQIDEAIRQQIKDQPVGTISELITTEYGYLICYKTGEHAPYESDYIQYHSQLAMARNEYQNTLVQQLKSQRMEEEWERMENESEIQRFRERLSEYLLREDGEK